MKTIRNLFILTLALVLTVDVSSFAQRRKWSPQARGTVIGAAAGGAAGAIINKRNRVVGGVIGGVVGGAAGYAIGKHQDNKNKARARAAAERAAAERAATERAALAKAEAAKKPLPATPANAAVNAAAQAPVYSAVASPAAYVNTAVYLPNNTVGDQSAPYGSSEYRRKSW
nr:glycine zipper domain-containing protein [uncultured Arsenicibacter sp.]